MGLHGKEQEIPDEYKMVLNWLTMNQRMAVLVNEQERARQQEIRDNVRVADLKMVWDEFYEKRDKRHGRKK